MSYLLDRLARNRFVTTDTWIGLALFAANLLVLGPWLAIDFSNQPWNNGYMYLANSRMFRDLPWTWNHLQYGGAPFNYLYPPLFSGLVGWMPFLSIGHAFHLLAGIAYAAAPVCLYVLARVLFGSRTLAALAAVAYSIFPSPAYLMPQWRAISQPFAHAPWAFLSLVTYDEAAHTFAFPLALLAAAMMWRKRWVAASLLAGAVFLTSWPALIGLGFVIAGITVARARDSGVFDALAASAGVIGVAYGIAAFWMTPGYFVSSSLLNRIVLRHTNPAAPWSGTTWIIIAVALAVIALALWRRVPGPVTVTVAWTALSGVAIVSFTLVGNYLIPLPHRYMLEFNAGAVLLAAGLVSMLPRRAQLAVAIGLVAVLAPLSYRFVTHAWKFEPASEDPRHEVAYNVSDWLSQHARPGRVLASGELDNTLNLWTNLAQVGGPGQDPVNFLMFAAERQVAFGCGAGSERVAELWLRALNAPWLVVHGAASREHYHWYSEPEKFAALPVAWDDGAGDTVYQLPNFEPQEAVVVNTAALAALPPLTSTADESFLRAYAAWSAGRPVPLHWNSAVEATFDANLAEGEAVLIKINNAPGWSAAGATLASDPIGFQLLRGPSGPHHFVLRYRAPWNAWLALGITMLTLLLLAARVRGAWVAAVAVLPAVAAWGLLMSEAPRTAQVAEEAFVRLHPPMINPDGIVDTVTFAPPPLGRGRSISIYGLNFGGPSDSVRVRFGDQTVSPDYRGATVLTARVPENAPDPAAVSVEVNGCRGNEFAVPIR